MNYLDLFSGIGGFAYGAWLAGMKFDRHYYSEIEPYCVQLYQQRFPEAVHLGDISIIEPDRLPEGDWIITGGFPCQDISTAGKGAGIEGKRSGLWFEMWRLIRDLRPRFVIAENVGALTFRGLDRVLSSLAEIGYDAEWQDIRASDMGAPHRRERIWIIAYPTSLRQFKGASERADKKREEVSEIGFNGENISNSTGKHDDNAGYGTSEICRKRQTQTEIQGDLADSTSERLQAQRERGWLQQTEKQTCPVIERRSLLGKEWCAGWWDAEPAMGRVANGVPHRVDRLRGLGNSIVPQIAAMLFEQIKPHLREV